MNLASLSIKRPTFIVSIVAIIMTLGLIAYSRLGVDMFPDVTFPYIAVFTPYRGAGPAEIETQVSKPLEEELSTIAGIKHMSSSSQDGLSMLTLEFTMGTDTKWAEQQVRDKVSAAMIKLPKEVDAPTFRRFDPADQPVLQLAIFADLPATQIYDIAKDDVKERLQQVANVGQVKILGGTQREIQVMLDREKLKAREVSLTSVSGRIASNSQNVPVGRSTKDGKDTNFRTLGEYRSIEQIKKAAVNFFGSDNPVSVADVAEVVDGAAETQTYAFYNGKPAVFIEVYRQSGANTVAVVDALMKQVKSLNAKFESAKGAPNLVMVRDYSKPTRMNVTDVKESILIGILLTILVVYYFLGSGRSTFITITALPNSLLGAFVLMYWQGFTINVITLMSLSLSVGLLIDDAIVVRENIWRHMEMGKEPKRAAIDGTKEVTMAVIATTLTVISVFLPVAFLQGTVGQFFKQMGWTIVFAMSISLFDAMTMAPLLSAYLAPKSEDTKDRLHSSHWSPGNPMRYLRASVEKFDAFQNWLTDKYEEIMHWALANRGKVLGISITAFLLTIVATAKFGKFEFMSTADTGFFQVSMEGAPGTALDTTREAARKAQAIMQQRKEVAQVALTVGNDQNENQKAYMYIELVNYRKRSMNTQEFKEIARKDLEGMKKEWNVRVGDVQMMGNMSPFTMILAGNDLESLSKGSEQVMQAFGGIKGLADLDSSYRSGKPEYQVVLDPDRMKRLGVNGVTVGMELRGQIDGAVPAKYREGDKEYDIRVRLKPEQRDLRDGLSKFWVPNMNFNMVRLSDVAAPKAASGPLKIMRRDRVRYVMISGELAKGGALGNIQSEAKKIMAKLELPKGVSYQFIGQAEDMQDLFISMIIAMGLAVLLIFLVLASLYESMFMPLLIMTALPLAFVGALGALIITGKSISMFSMIGIIMLLGLVAKNSILLVDYTIHLIRRGRTRREALILAGRTRLRPILMTSVALIAGTLPLALALSETSRFRQSMGITIIGGLLSSTVLTLVVVPAFYEWFDDTRLKLRHFFGRPALREIDAQETEEAMAQEAEETKLLKAHQARRTKKA
jgi:HAE1 family hydrophobic/amphiphilic exporter-1